MKLLACAVAPIMLTTQQVRAQAGHENSFDELQRIYGMQGRQQFSPPATPDELSAALAIQELRQSVPQAAEGFDTYLSNDQLLSYLRAHGGPDLYYLLEWNHFALDMNSLDHTLLPGPNNSDNPKRLYAEQFAPARSSRALAMVHLAMFEAVNVISKKYRSYVPPGRSTSLQDAILSAVSLKSSDVTAATASIPSAIVYAAYHILGDVYPQKIPLLYKNLVDTVAAIPNPHDEAAKIDLGQRIGIAAAEAVAQMRSDDGSAASGQNHSPCTEVANTLCLEPRFPLFFEDKPNFSDWQPDPVTRALIKVGGTWPDVTPFVIAKHQFIKTTPAGRDYLDVNPAIPSEQKPPLYTEKRFTDAYGNAEYGPAIEDPQINPRTPDIKMIPSRYGVRKFGGAFSAGLPADAPLPQTPMEGKRWNTPTLRNSDQTFRANFWGYDGTALLCAPPRLYNMIATSVALRNKIHAIDTVQEMSRYLAIVNLALADAAVAAWDAKYHFHIARPASFIRYKNTPQPAGEMADEHWTPYGQVASNGSEGNATPPFPSYPSGHAVFGGALFQTMSRYWGVDKNDKSTAFRFVSDEYNGVNHGLNGLPRDLIPVYFRSFGAAEWENAESRIWLGIHWQFDADDGIALGDAVADYVYDHALQGLP